jgi:hypothetical protein
VRHARSPSLWPMFLCVVASLAIAGCQDQSLGALGSPDSSAQDATVDSKGAPTCASIGGTCRLASSCVVGQGHLTASPTSDCSSGGGTTVCCLPESACPTETFMCCGGGAAMKTRPLCETGTSAMPAKLVCATGLSSC